MVLGHQAVGKSAFVVRLLTRRFIGDYDPNMERTYSVNTVMDNDHFTLEVFDSSGHHLEDGTQSDLEDQIRWADAFILMYSVTDKCSFDECCRLKFLIGYNKRRRRHLFGSTFGNVISHDCPPNVPVILVANKIDQESDRMVASDDGSKRSRGLDCDHFFEISVREQVDFPKRIVEQLYASWKRSHLPVSSLAHSISIGLSGPTSNQSVGSVTITISTITGLKNCNIILD